MELRFSGVLQINPAEGEEPVGHLSSACKCRTRGGPRQPSHLIAQSNSPG